MTAPPTATRDPGKGAVLPQDSVAARLSYDLNEEGGAMTVTIRRAERRDVAALGRLGAMLMRTHYELDPQSK